MDDDYQMKQVVQQNQKTLFPNINIKSNMSHTSISENEMTANNMLSTPTVQNTSITRQDLNRSMLKRKTEQLSSIPNTGLIEIDYSEWCQKPEYRASLKTAVREEFYLPISSQPKRQQLYYLYKMIINRRTFEYGLRHVFRYYLKCIFCRSRNTLRKVADGKRDIYFDRASRKLKKDLDIVTLL